MFQEILQQPILLRLWIFFMIAVNLCSLLFLNYSGARWVVFFNICNIPLVTLLYREFGFSRILGLSHVICWTPLVIVVWAEKALFPASTIYGGWLRLLLLTNVVSLVMDYSDVTRYVFEKYSGKA